MGEVTSATASAPAPSPGPPEPAWERAREGWGGWRGHEYMLGRGHAAALPTTRRLLAPGL